MENFQPLDEAMHYQLSAIGMLRLLGYNQPIGTGWLEQLKQDKQINLPKTYTEFMELMVDCPLLSTSNLWVGKMKRAAMRIPHTYYDELRERIDDYKGRWSKRPASRNAPCTNYPNSHRTMGKNSGGLPDYWQRLCRRYRRVWHSNKGFTNGGSAGVLAQGGG